jgi:hypothetical protein
MTFLLRLSASEAIRQSARCHEPPQHSRTFSTCFGRDEGAKQTYYGRRAHLRVCWPGVIAEGHLAPANLHDLVVADDLLAGTHGWVLGDRSYGAQPEPGCWPTTASCCWHRRPARPKATRATPAPPADPSTAADRDGDRPAGPAL